MDALDLAAIGKVPGDIGCGIIQRLAFQQFIDLGFGLATQTRLFLLQPFGLNTLVLFLLRTDGIGLGQVHFLARAGWLALRCM